MISDVEVPHVIADCQDFASCIIAENPIRNHRPGLAAVGEVAGRGLQEEEGFFGYGIVQFLDVVCIVPTYGDNLAQL